jgi:hypothetical protein
MKDYVKSGGRGNSWIVSCFPDPGVNHKWVAVLSTRWFLRIAACLVKAWSLPLEDPDRGVLNKVREQMSAETNSAATSEQ